MEFARFRLRNAYGKLFGTKNGFFVRTQVASRSAPGQDNADIPARSGTHHLRHTFGCSAGELCREITVRSQQRLCLSIKFRTPPHQGMPQTGLRGDGLRVRGGGKKFQRAAEVSAAA